MKKGINNLLYSKDLNTIDLLSPTFWQDIHLISPKELCTISMEDIQSGIQNQMDQLECQFQPT